MYLHFNPPPPVYKAQFSVTFILLKYNTAFAHVL